MLIFHVLLVDLFIGILLEPVFFVQLFVVLILILLESLVVLTPGMTPNNTLRTTQTG